MNQGKVTNIVLDVRIRTIHAANGDRSFLRISFLHVLRHSETFFRRER